MADISNYVVLKGNLIEDTSNQSTPTSITVLDTAATTLTITETPSTTKILKGHNKPLIFTVTIANSGAAASGEIALEMTLDSQLTFKAATSTSGFTESGGVVSGTIASIAVGATTTVTIGTTV